MRPRERLRARVVGLLQRQGYNRTDRKYMIFGESRVYCGIGTFAGDDRAGAASFASATRPRSDATGSGAPAAMASST